MRTSYALGRVIPAENDLLLGRADAWSTPGAYPGVLWSGGLGQTPAGIIAYDSASLFDDVLRTVAEAYPMLAGDFGGLATWANDLVRTDLSLGKTYLQGGSTPLRASAGGVFLLGYSMGWADVASWARTNVADVRAAVAVSGAHDVNAIYSTNRNGMAAGITAAHGGSYSVAVDGPTTSPLAFASQLTFPILAYHGVGDTTVTIDEARAFRDAAPDCQLVELAGGHTDYVQTPRMLAEIVEFLRAHEA